MNYAQFDAGTLEGLVLLAQERMNLAAQQVPGILTHIAEHEAHVEEQRLLVERFKAQYDIDEAFVQGAYEFISRGGQQQALPQVPQQQQFQPTHQFPPFPQPALQHLPPQGPAQPQQMQQAPFQQPQQFQQAQQPAPSRVVQGQGQPPFPQAPAQQPAQQLGDGGVTPLPFGRAGAASATMAVTGSRRSHLMPNPNGPGFIPNPDFVDEFGMRPATEITDEMRAAWARDQKPEVHVMMPGEEGHVPAGGANLKVKINGAMNDVEETSDIEIVEPSAPSPEGP